MPFIRLADLVINVDYVAAVQLSSYGGSCNGDDIPVVNICLAIPEGALDNEAQCCSGGCTAVETLEFESDLAMAIWDYFLHSKDVTVLFE